jgi:hypothetical protein
MTELELELLLEDLFYARYCGFSISPFDFIFEEN